MRRVVSCFFESRKFTILEGAACGEFGLSFILRIKINIYCQVPRSVQSVTLHIVFVALLHQSTAVLTTEALLLET